MFFSFRGIFSLRYIFKREVIGVFFEGLVRFLFDFFFRFLLFVVFVDFWGVDLVLLGIVSGKVLYCILRGSRRIVENDSGFGSG